MHKCNLCGGLNLLPLINFGNQPVVKKYLDKRTDERPTWPMNLFFCESCGLTQLVDSCPPEVLYENYITLSMWKNQPHVQHEIDALKGLEGIGPSTKIIEIGSNDGMFLHQLALNGFKNTLGVEPSKDAFEASRAGGLNVVNAFLTPELSRAMVNEHGQFDVFLSRQNLEHISDLQGVAESIDILVRPGGFVLIEVPDHDCQLRNDDYGLWEEHVNYFTVDTLRHFLAYAGVEMLHSEIILFSGEALFTIGRKVGGLPRSTAYVPALRKQNVKYAEHWPAFRRAIGDFLVSHKKQGKKIAVYGAGSRTFCLINFTGIYTSIDMIVDDQPEKQNKFMPGGRLPIVPSDALYSENIDICLLAVNAENEEKVITKHEKWVQRGGVFWSILPPSARLLPVWQMIQA